MATRKINLLLPRYLGQGCRNAWLGVPTSIGTGALAPVGVVRTKPTVQNPRNRALIESAVLLLVIALTVILIGVGQYFLDLKRFREDQRQQERLVVDQARLVIQGALASAVSDIRILAQIVERVGVPASLGDSRAGTLAEYFSTLARERPMYDQIRLLNYPGREIVRINLSPEGLEVVERQDLQDKSKRYYFTQARDLEAGQIYISPVDVNVEWGESEAVPRPMFRVATPVFDDGGHPRGVVLINYRGEALAEIFRAGMGAAGDRLTVLDQRGYWLSSPRQELEWGFAYDSDARFQNHYPTIWRQMAQQVSGTHLNRRGMFTFTRLNSLSSAGVLETSSPAWFVVSLFPAGLLRQELGLGNYLIAYGLLLLLVMLATVGYGIVRAAQLGARVWLGQCEPLVEALKYAPNPVIATDLSDHIVFVNDSVLEYSGYSRAHLLGKSRIDTLVAPTAGEACRARLRELSGGKRDPGLLDAGLYGRGGDNYRLNWSESLQRNSAGVVTGVVYLGAVPRQELPEDERFRRLAVATEQSPVSVMITDIDGHIEYVNARFSELTGYSSAEVLGCKPSILKSGKTPPEDYRQLWANLKAGRDWKGVFYNRKKSGQVYSETARISPLRNEAGEITHFLATKEDITERTRLEKNFKLAVEAAPSAMVLSNSDGLIVLANSRAEQMFGYSREEILGQPIEILVPQQARKHHAGLRREYRRAPATREMGTGVALFGEHRDGHRIPVDIGLNPIDTEDGIMVLSSIIDLTVHETLKHKLEERNRQVVETHALATVGRMAAMVAHDLRNPLSSVKMGLQIMSRSSDKGSDSGDEELRVIALEQVQYMENILNELLAYSRPPVLKREWFDITKTIERTILLCQEQLQRYQVQLNAWNQPSLPTIYGDSHRLQQVVSNLIMNAIEACAEAGTVSPRISVRTHLDLGEETPVIRIEIIDNGPGLDAEAGRRAFDAFFTSRAKGTGLGLTIVRQIIGAHSGIVTLENEPVGGARASIILPTRPLQKPDKQADTPVALAAGPGGIAGEARITKADG